METLDVVLETVRDVSYFVIRHPFLSVLGCILLFLLYFRLYFRLTLGVYEGNQDMTGKTVVITGASAGIGKATALDMAKRNARVIMAYRNLSKAQKVADDIKSASHNDDVFVKRLDLSSFQSVRQCAEDILRTEDKLHVLINNAGIVHKGPGEALTEDGNDMMMQSNHLGHFLLTMLLLDLLKKTSPSRIINVASTSHKDGTLDPADLKNEVSTLQSYANTKLANVLFTVDLARRLQGSGVTVNSLCPGLVNTEILNNTPGMFYVMLFLGFNLLGKSIHEGAQTTIRLAVDPLLEKVTGKYFHECREQPMRGSVKTDQGRVLDIRKVDKEEYARRLFETSEKIVGVSYQ